MSEAWEFGPINEERKFTLDLNGALFLNQPARLALRLSRRPRHVLLHLLKQRGQVVALSELGKPDGIPGCITLNKADSARHSVEKLRKLLDPQGRDKPIVTARGIGYQFSWRAVRVPQQAKVSRPDSPCNCTS